jgi:hypothetical protein
VIIKSNSRYQQNIFSALLFALAILILLLSCPLKHLLQNDFNPNSPVTSKSNQTNNTRYFNTSYNNSSTYCTAINKSTILQAHPFLYQKVDAPVFTLNIYNHTGYYIHLFLSDIKPLYSTALRPDYSSLPIFIQHRSFLI